eukprot:4872664-Prymnesium_polylepis.1
MVTFMDAGSAATAASLAHYTPVGSRLQVLSPKQYRHATGKPDPAVAAQAAVAQAAAQAALPVGWSCGWSAEYGMWYYCNAALGVTQWEPPATAGGLVDYSDDEEEEEEEEAAAGGEGAAEAAAEGEAADGWFYGDPSGTVHGPFAPNVMSGWVAQGALPADTPVCRVGEEDFVALGE